MIVARRSAPCENSAVVMLSNRLGSWVLLVGMIGVGCSSGPRVSTGSGFGSPSTGMGSGDSSSQGLPPIAGGTLLVTNDSERAFVSDPDRERIVVVDLPGRRVV